MPKKKLGELLLLHDVITPEQLDQALAAQRNEGGLLGEVLLRLGFVQQEALGAALSGQLGFPYVAIENEEIDPQVPLFLPERFCREHTIVAFRVRGDTLHTAMVAPDNLWAISEIQLLTGYTVEPFVSSYSGIVRVLDQSFDRKLRTRQTIVDMRLDELKKGGVARHTALLAPEAVDASDVPVVRLVNSILSGGIAAGASDIHFEPQHFEMRVRYRIDGVLYDNMNIPSHIEGALVSRVKVMADLDITERRHPQDGHISFTNEGKSYDLRVSTMPTVAGEKIVLRVLEKDSNVFRLDHLGLSASQRAIVERFISRPYGMILVTGPTGSGKSTSLYAMLNELHRPEINIVTLEDPVENQLPGMNQIGVNPNYGMSFVSGLKYILRQDPDIIMVGEIRDGETAQVAVQAALTGHLLLSTLHTNDAAGAVTRLVELGVQSFLVSSSVVGILAQRLLRRVCPDCAESYQPDDATAADFGPYADRVRGGAFLVGRGCDRCLGTGYRGRVAVFEIMPMSAPLVDLVARNAGTNEIKAEAIREGMATLTDAAIERALAGESTLQEVRERVLVWELDEQRAATTRQGHADATRNCSVAGSV